MLSKFLFFSSCFCLSISLSIFASDFDHQNEPQEARTVSVIAPSDGISCTSPQFRLWLNEFEALIKDIEAYKKKWESFKVVNPQTQKEEVNDAERAEFLEKLNSSRGKIDEQIAILRHHLEAVVGFRSAIINPQNLIPTEVVQSKVQVKAATCDCQKEISWLDHENWAYDMWHKCWDCERGIATCRQHCMVAFLSHLLTGGGLALAGVLLPGFAGLAQGMCCLVTSPGRAECHKAEYETVYSYGEDFGIKASAFLGQMKAFHQTMSQLLSQEPEFEPQLATAMEDDKDMER